MSVYSKVIAEERERERDRDREIISSISRRRRPAQDLSCSSHIFLNFRQDEPPESLSLYYCYLLLPGPGWQPHSARAIRGRCFISHNDPTNLRPMMDHFKRLVAPCKQNKHTHQKLLMLMQITL